MCHLDFTAVEWLILVSTCCTSVPLRQTLRPATHNKCPALACADCKHPEEVVHQPHRAADLTGPSSDSLSALNFCGSTSALLPGSKMPAQSVIWRAICSGELSRATMTGSAPAFSRAASTAEAHANCTPHRKNKAPGWQFSASFKQFGPLMGANQNFRPLLPIRFRITLVPGNIYPSTSCRVADSTSGVQESILPTITNQIRSYFDHSQADSHHANPARLRWHNRFYRSHRAPWRRLILCPWW